MTTEDRRREMDDLAGGGLTYVSRPRRFDPSLLPPPKGSEEEDEVDLSYKAVYTIKQGVPVRWLALVFGITEHQVKARLKHLRPIDVGAHGNPLYAVPEAASYLVDQKMDLQEFLRGIKDDDLPDDLRLKLWNARRQRNKVLQEEGELWHSSVVLEKFSEVLLAIREKLQLIPEQVERMTGITPEQYKVIRAIVDATQEQMYQTAMEIAESDNTPSLLGETEEVVL